MTDIAYTLQKPFAVTVEAGGKLMKKEFDTREEAASFSETIRAKVPQAEIRIVEKKVRLKGREGQPFSIGFVPVIDRRTGRPFLDAYGRPTYKPVPVPKKRGLMFCPNCHDYRRFIQLEAKYGLTYRGCEECGISDNDFDVKTCNELWERVTV